MTFNQLLSADAPQQSGQIDPFAPLLLMINEYGVTWMINTKRTKVFSQCRVYGQYIYTILIFYDSGQEWCIYCNIASGKG